MSCEKKKCYLISFEISDTKLDQRHLAHDYPHLVHDLPISHTITAQEATAIRPKTAKSPDRLLCRGFCQFGIRVQEV